MWERRSGTSCATSQHPHPLYLDRASDHRPYGDGDSELEVLVGSDDSRRVSPRNVGIGADGLKACELVYLRAVKRPW